MVEIELLGELSQFEIPPLKIRSVPEAIKLISSQIPEFAEVINESSKSGIDYQILADGETIQPEELYYPVLSKITFTPVISGSGDIGRALLGIALIGLSFLVPGGILGIGASTIGTAGLALTLGGVFSLLTPKPGAQKNENSYTLSSGGQGLVQGQAVPVLFGECWIEPPRIAADVEIEDTRVDFVPPESNLLIWTN